MMDLEELRAEIAAATDADVASELLDAYDELKGRFFRHDVRPGQLEAGRFAEAAFRILQLKATGSYTPIGRSLPSVPSLLQTLESADPTQVHDSIRLNIPRALAAVYNIRNRRDVGHIAADVDANEMDAKYVVAACSWVLAEFVRLFHRCTPQEAQALVDAITKRCPPFVQTFGTTPFVTRPGLSAKDEIMLLLYHQGSRGASLDELDVWLPTISRATIRSRITELERRDRFARRIDGRILVTDPGLTYVEVRIAGSGLGLHRFA